MLKMNVQVIARKLKHGELIGYKIGKDWRVKESDLMAWLEKNSNRHAQNPAQVVVDRFLRNGRFYRMPVQRKRRKYVLEYILKAFESNRVYSEKEVNEVIQQYFDDFCRVRREFVDEKMMTRNEGKYRLSSSYKTSL